MSIQIKCAWCGALLGTKQGKAMPGFDISHTICPSCTVKVSGEMALWDGVERRLLEDRRKGERRTSMRSSVNTLIVIDGITWIDNKGTNRRHSLRRRSDRERLANIITDGLFK